MNLLLTPSADNRDLRTRLILLLGQSFTLGILLALLVITVNALFLSDFGSSTLPYVYLLVALLGSLVSYGSAKAQSCMDFASSSDGDDNGRNPLFHRCLVSPHHQRCSLGFLYPHCCLSPAAANWLCHLRRAGGSYSTFAKSSSCFHKLLPVSSSALLSADCS